MYIGYDGREYEDPEMDSMLADAREAANNLKHGIVVTLKMSEEELQSLFTLVAGKLDSVSDLDMYIQELQSIASQLSAQAKELSIDLEEEEE